MRAFMLAVAFTAGAYAASAPQRIAAPLIDPVFHPGSDEAENTAWDFTLYLDSGKCADVLPKGWVDANGAIRIPADMARDGLAQCWVRFLPRA